MNNFQFRDTKQALEDVLKLLKCVKCSRLPRREETFFLTKCDHKYCDHCLKTGGKCSSCDEKIVAKHAIPDLFSKGLLTKLLEFENLLETDGIKVRAVTNSVRACNTSHETAGDDDEVDIKSVSDIFSPTPEKKKNDDDKGMTMQKIDQKPKTSDSNIGAKAATQAKARGVATRNRNKSKILLSKEKIKSKPATKFENALCEDLQGKYEGTASISSNKLPPQKLKQRGKITSPPESTLSPVRQVSGNPDFFNLGSPEQSPPNLTQHELIPEELLLANRTSSPHFSEREDESSYPPILTPHSTPDKHVLLPIRRGSDRNRQEKVDLEEKVHVESLEVKRNVDAQPSSKSKKATNRSKGKAGEIRGRKSSTSSSNPATSKFMTPTPAPPSSRASSVVSSVSCESPATPASLEKRNAKGETSLHVAARLGKIEKVKQLIEAGANINATDFAGWTPLHEAINGKTSNNLEVATMLCEAGCHISTPGMASETPLHEASRLGLLSIISLLLHYGANKNISNQSGHLPRDVAKTEEVAKVIDEFSGPTVRNCEIDPVLSATEERRIYFTYDISTEQLDTFKSEFGLQIASELSGDVTHIIFEAEPDEIVPLTLDYLLGVLSGAWLLSSNWVVDLLRRKEWLDPEAYEIGGCKDETHFSSKNGDPDTAADEVLVTKRARTNGELRNPGLFQGINFYLYKDCTYKSLTKKNLAKLITTGDGVVINRDPNPDTVDPLENPTRFHAKDPLHKMVLTSHVILFNPDTQPTKKHNMEHVKALKVDWLIQSILQFQLKDPDFFLN